MKRKRMMKSAMAVSVAVAMTLSTASAAMAGDLSANGKYYSDFDTYAELLEHVGEVNKQTAEEGQVLLKNDGTLPLSGSEKVSVFGVSSATTVGGPSGTSAYEANTDFDVSDRGPIYDGLTAAGFDVNPTLADYYAGQEFSNENIGDETTEFSDDAVSSIAEYN